MTLGQTLDEASWAPCPSNISLKGSIKAICVLNILGNVMCVLLVTQDVAEKRGFAEIDFFYNDNIHANNSTSANNLSTIALSPDSILTLRCIVWALLLTKDLIDTSISICLFRATANMKNILVSKAYITAVFFYIFAYVCFAMDVLQLRSNYPYDISTLMATLYHVLYKPYTILSVLKYMAEVKRVQVKWMDKRTRDLTLEEVAEFYKGAEIAAVEKLGSANLGLCSSQNDVSLDILKIQDDDCEKYYTESKSQHLNSVGFGFNKDLEVNMKADVVLIDASSAIGSGEYGSVYLGNLLKSGKTQPLAVDLRVAVKTTKDCADAMNVEYFKAILSEIKILSHLGQHENIVNLIGVDTSKIRNQKIWILLEYCELGSLHSYLRGTKGNLTNQIDNNGQWIPAIPSVAPPSGAQSNYVQITNPVVSTTDSNHVTSMDIVSWAYDISKGMEFLQSKRVLHGDLATRNVLLTADKRAKICDFGLSRKLYSYEIYARNCEALLPWRWMAPEGLTDLIFSNKSDVWSFGVVLWELFALGEVPYRGLDWTPEFLKQLKDGMRLTSPGYCPELLYETMIHCWATEPNQRPYFHNLSLTLLKFKNAGINALSIEN